MTKRMSKTLAAEIAARTLEVTEAPAQLVDRAELTAWLLATYAPRD